MLSNHILDAVTKRNDKNCCTFSSCEFHCWYKVAVTSNKNQYLGDMFQC